MFCLDTVRMIVIVIREKCLKLELGREFSDTDRFFCEEKKL